MSYNISFFANKVNVFKNYLSFPILQNSYDSYDFHNTKRRQKGKKRLVCKHFDDYFLCLPDLYCKMGKLKI
jgi:hypothetical protein